MPRIPLFVAAVALGNLLVPLNSTMIVVALPQIARDLGADKAAVSWLVTAYPLAMASLPPLGVRVPPPPQPARALGADKAAVSWLVTAYLIAMASLQPIGGRVGDRFGRRE